MSLITKCKSKNCLLEQECVRKKKPSFPSKMWDYDDNNKDFMLIQKIEASDIKKKEDCKYFYPK
jgi:hypothetical protein